MKRCAERPFGRCFNLGRRLVQLRRSHGEDIPVEGVSAFTNRDLMLGGDQSCTNAGLPRSPELEGSPMAIRARQLRPESEDEDRTNDERI